jgi:hypothetical protein
MTNTKILMALLLLSAVLLRAHPAYTDLPRAVALYNARS